MTGERKIIEMLMMRTCRAQSNLDGRRLRRRMALISLPVVSQSASHKGRGEEGGKTMRIAEESWTNRFPSHSSRMKSLKEEAEAEAEAEEEKTGDATRS
jgi:hypothetical protein